MSTSHKAPDDRRAGETMLTDIFKVVEKLNATAGPTMAKTGTKAGNMTFSPKIVVDDEGEKHYTCLVEIYTPASTRAGTEINMEWATLTVEQFKQTLPTIFIALTGLAQQGYLSDTYTVGLITPDGDESEIYAPETLEPGMYSLKEELEEQEEDH